MTDDKKIPQARRDEIMSKMGNLGEVYEDLLEAQIKALHDRMVMFISQAQVPLVHVNMVLDLIKKENLDQIQKGYWPDRKVE